ncbi:TetR/AcrR family transcriptional regulator [Cohnella sp.]|uniref:TetR/AcrR family transcriptional regulator n=1 Tax=Cohnella sp. TaxID=1883426 RepID=UPI003565FA35
MPTNPPTRSRTYDAARTKETILDAAEEIFAELGYSAARIDAIAKASGYNKSLIYQYFGDKLGLYTEVVKRADQIGDQVTGRIIARLMNEGGVASDAAKFKSFLETTTRSMYEFLLEHPRYRKILYWEAAEEWKTWNRITYRPDDLTHLHELAQSAKSNGILRKDLDPALVPVLIMNVTTTTLQSFSRFGNLLGNADSQQRQKEIMEQLIQIVIHGVMEPSSL